MDAKAPNYPNADDSVGAWGTGSTLSHERFGCGATDAGAAEGFGIDRAYQDQKDLSVQTAEIVRSADLARI